MDAEARFWRDKWSEALKIIDVLDRKYLEAMTKLKEAKKRREKKK